MSGEQAQSALQRKIAEAKARKLAEQNQAPAETQTNSQQFEKYQAAIPEPNYESDPFNELLNNLSILDAYNRWCGKSRPAPRPGQKDGIKVSCPRPDHRDQDPSAWVNIESNTWYCGRCQTGGDIYDIAAIHFQIKDYKTGANFGKLRKLMAESLGYGVAKIGKKDVPYLKAVPDSEPEPPQVVIDNITDYKKYNVDPESQPPPATPTLPVATVQKSNEEVDAELAEVIALDSEQIIFPTLHWQKVVTPGTFLDEYMNACVIDDIAEEFHFWNALVALGLAAGKDAVLVDSPPVYGNLFVCLLGHTGDGKSRSMRYLYDLLMKALPYDKTQDYPKGAFKMPTPSSAEALIDLFDHPVMDPNDPKRIADHAPIRGLVEFGEMAELAGKSSRLGNTLKPTVIDFYDMKPVVSTTSRTSGIKEAMHPFCSMLTSTQPDALKTILGQVDKSSGFLNRWIFASGKPKTRSFFQEDIVDLSVAQDLLAKIAGWIGFGKQITVDEDAIIILEKFYRENLSHLLKEANSGIYSRLPLLYKKLLLLLAINEHSSVVTPEIAEKVISMHEYSTQSYQLPEKSIGSDDLTVVYEELRKQIIRLNKNGEGPSLSQINRTINSKNYSIAHVHRAFKILEERGEIEIYAKENTKGGRPVQRFRWTG